MESWGGDIVLWLCRGFLASGASVLTTGMLQTSGTVFWAIYDGSGMQVTKVKSLRLQVSMAVRGEF